MKPFLEKKWQDHMATFGSRLRQAYQKGPAYPKSQPYASRRDSYPPDGGRPGSVEEAAHVRIREEAVEAPCTAENERERPDRCH